MELKALLLVFSLPYYNMTLDKIEWRKRIRVADPN